MERCLHYDNWNTIIYWLQQDPAVYEKCAKHGCSKTIILTPSQAAQDSFDFYENTKQNMNDKGDGVSYVLKSKFSQSDNINLLKDGYAESLARAELIGHDDYTDNEFAGKDAVAKYTDKSCVLSWFPENIKKNMYERLLSYEELNIQLATTVEPNPTNKYYTQQKQRFDLCNELYNKYVRNNLLTNKNLKDKIYLPSILDYYCAGDPRDYIFTQTSPYKYNPYYMEPNNTTSAMTSKSSFPLGSYYLRSVADSNSIYIRNGDGSLSISPLINSDNGYIAPCFSIETAYLVN